MSPSEPIDLDRLSELEKQVAKNDEGEPWVVAALRYKDDRVWSIGPDHEMGHRAELADWCDHEAHLLAALRNAAPAFLEAVRALQDVDLKCAVYGDQELTCIEYAADDETGMRPAESLCDTCNLWAKLAPFRSPVSKESE